MLFVVDPDLIDMSATKGVDPVDRMEGGRTVRVFESHQEKYLDADIRNIIGTA